MRASVSGSLPALATGAAMVFAIFWWNISARLEAEDRAAQALTDSWVADDKAAAAEVGRLEAEGNITQALKKAKAAEVKAATAEAARLEAERITARALEKATAAEDKAAAAEAARLEAEGLAQACAKAGRQAAAG